MSRSAINKSKSKGKHIEPPKLSHCSVLCARRQRREREFLDFTNNASIVYHDRAQCRIYVRERTTESEQRAESMIKRNIIENTGRKRKKKFLAKFIKDGDGNDDDDGHKFYNISRNFAPNVVSRTEIYSLQQRVRFLGKTSTTYQREQRVESARERTRRDEQAKRLRNSGDCVRWS